MGVHLCLPACLPACLCPGASRVRRVLDGSRSAAIPKCSRDPMRPPFPPSPPPSPPPSFTFSRHESRNTRTTDHRGLSVCPSVLSALTLQPSKLNRCVFLIRPVFPRLFSASRYAREAFLENHSIYIPTRVRSPPGKWMFSGECAPPPQRTWASPSPSGRV